jgi:hypothetical protein|nr:MAG TPA: hypothetical protein [Caudoviricetes sp.]
MLLTKYKVQEIVDNTHLTKKQVEEHMRLMHLTPEPYLATFAVIMTEVLKDKIIDELGRI